MRFQARRVCMIQQHSLASNPKLEIPNPKQIRISEIQMAKTGRLKCLYFQSGLYSVVSVIWIFDVVLVSDFVLRISDFFQRDFAESRKVV
jgi:hypothetical protein